LSTCARCRTGRHVVVTDVATVRRCYVNERVPGSGRRA
jgi:hypothetical protein